MLIKIAIIKRLPNGRYRLYSRKKDKKGKRRNLGTFNSLEDAKKREKQVQLFKYHADDQNNRDKETKALSVISDAAKFLEEAGYIERATEMYAIMDAIDGNLDDEDDAADFIPDAQRNIENEGTISGLGGTGGSAGMFAPMEAEKVATKLVELANRFDKFGLYEEANKIDVLLNKFAMEKDPYDFHIANAVKLIKRDYQDGLFENIPTEKLLHLLAKRLKMNINNRQEGGFLAGLAVAMGILEPRDAFGDPEAYQSALLIFRDPDAQLEMDNIDALVGANGLDNNSVIDNQNSGMFQGFSDSYFYSNYENQEGPYMHTKITI